MATLAEITVGVALSRTAWASAQFCQQIDPRSTLDQKTKQIEIETYQNAWKLLLSKKYRQIKFGR
jgi:hypothetical protein